MKHSQSDCFCEGIRAFREHGWLRATQKELCKRIGYTQTHISQVFKGKRNASIDLQERLSNEFGLNAEDVY